MQIKWKHILLLLFLSCWVAACTSNQPLPTGQTPTPENPAALQPAGTNGVTVDGSLETPEAVVDWRAAATVEPTLVAEIDTAVSDEAVAPDEEIQILVADETMCDRVVDLNANYAQPTTVVCAHNVQSFADMVSSYDFLESDMYIFPDKWLLQAAQAQKLVDLTHFLRVSEDDTAYAPNIMRAYEYPRGSGQQIGVPLQTDMQLLVYRQDLLDAAHLQPAQSWDELQTQAEQLHVENDGVAGLVTAWCDSAACFESITAVWQQMARSTGTKLWDAESHQALDVLDNSNNQAIVTQLQALYNTNSGDAAQMTAASALEAICTGQAAIALTWVSDVQTFLRAGLCAEQTNLSFAPLPDSTENSILLNSTGVGINANSQMQEQAMNYLAWIYSFESQTPWVMLGGLPVHQQIIQDDAFLYSSPVAPTFAASLQYAQAPDEPIAFSHAIYLQAPILRQAVLGELSAEEGLAQIATHVQAVLDESYIE